MKIKLLLVLMVVALAGCCVTLPENNYERPKTFIPINDTTTVQKAGKAIEMSCPICGNCIPTQGGGWTTLMYCEDGCCNSTTWDFFCNGAGTVMVYHGDSLYIQGKPRVFTKTINECDWIVWGKFK